MRDEREDKASASEVAAGLVALMPGWKVKPYPAHDDGDARTLRQWARLVREDGAEICLSIQTYPALRLRVSGDFPRRDGRMYGRHDLSPHITLDPFKAVPKIYADIARRLLPKYLELYAEGKAEAEAADRRQLESNNLGERLSAIVGERWHNEPHLRREEQRIYCHTEAEGASWSITIRRDYGNEARFDVTLPGPLALELAEWLKARIMFPPTIEDPEAGDEPSFVERHGVLPDVNL